MSSINVPSVFSIRQCKEGTSPSILYIQSVNTPAPIECTYMGVINGKTGKTAGLSTFLDILTLSQSRGTDYAHHYIGFVFCKKSFDYPADICNSSNTH